MTHEKHITDERGRITIIVAPLCGYFDDRVSYNIQVSFIPKGKRKVEYNRKDIATPEEIYAAKMELWERIRPIL